MVNARFPAKSVLRRLSRIGSEVADFMASPCSARQPAAREKSWGAFRDSPDWKKLSSTPGYTDPEIVSNITTVFLRPASYSQI